MSNKRTVDLDDLLMCILNIVTEDYTSRPYGSQNNNDVYVEGIRAGRKNTLDKLRIFLYNYIEKNKHQLPDPGDLKIYDIQNMSPEELTKCINDLKGKV